MLKRLLLCAILVALTGCASAPATRGAGVPGQPPRVLIIGDAISMGVGALGADTDCALGPDTNSLAAAYGVRIANTLDTDYEIIARPEIGLVRNYSGLVEDTLSQRLQNREQRRLLDAAGPMQLVLVNIGTHDFHQYDATAAFVPAMEDLLTMLAGRYPEATIYALTGPMLGGTEAELHNMAVQTAVDTVNARLGTRIRYLPLNGGDPEIALGCAWHPSIYAHEHMAQMILNDMAHTNAPAPPEQ